MGPGDVSNMVTEDMEAWRGFLVQKNNEKALNLNKLCLVGSEMGASVALHWALRDWNWLAWSAGKRKPSVKALVLLSPQRRFMGLDIREPLANPVVRSGLSVMILVGKQDPKALTQANALHTSLAKYHPQPPAGLDEEALRLGRGEPGPVLSPSTPSWRGAKCSDSHAQGAGANRGVRRLAAGPQKQGLPLAGDRQEAVTRSQGDRVTG